MVNTAVTVDVLANDSNADGDPLSVDSVTQPANGSVNINTDDTVTYTPHASHTGSDTFTYTVSDGRGGTATGSVTITIDGALNPPTGSMTVNPANLPELEWHMVWINNHNTIGNLVRVTADIPAGTTFIDGSLACDVRGNSTLIRCDFETAGSQMVSMR